MASTKRPKPSQSSKSTAAKASRSPRREAPARPAGVDLSAIEKELNSDAEAQGAFVKNPGKFLQDRGLALRPADRAELKNLARELTSGPKAAEGSLAGSEAAIKITIRRWIR